MKIASQQVLHFNVLKTFYLDINLKTLYYVIFMPPNKKKSFFFCISLALSNRVYFQYFCSTVRDCININNCFEACSFNYFVPVCFYAIMHLSLHCCSWCFIHFCKIITISIARSFVVICAYINLNFKVVLYVLNDDEDDNNRISYA